MTEANPDDPFEGLQTGQTRVPIELLALLVTLLGGALVVWGAWAFDWRAALIVLGVLLVAGGITVGSEGG